MTEGLKACPFCGSGALCLSAEGESGHDKRGHALPYQVRCQSCGAQTVQCFVRSLAVDAWNRRAPAWPGG